MWGRGGGALLEMEEKLRISSESKLTIIISFICESIDTIDIEAKVKLAVVKH